MIRGSFQMMKSVNKSLILNKIRTNQPISRAQIAKETKLTPPTVSNIVKELIDQAIVFESKLGDSKGGRKPTLLRINNKRFFVIGVEVSPTKLQCLLTDLSGNELNHISHELDASISELAFMNLLKEVIQQMMHTLPKQETIIGIGVAMHGVVNVDEGTALFAPNLQLNNIPIKRELEKEFHLPVTVENDARAMALGEHWFGKHHLTTNMLFMNIGYGVGAGTIVNGKLYHGEDHLAGEVGHMTIDINGNRCECGNKGCLQTFASEQAIIKRANTYASEKHYQDIEELYQAAIQGDQISKQVLEEAGRYIGIGLTNLIHIMNPEIIVLGGGVMKAADIILPTVKTEIKNRGLTESAGLTEVTLSTLGKKATLLGAISLILIELFESP